MRAQKVFYILILIAILLVFLLVTAMDGLLSPALPEAYAQSGITASDTQTQELIERVVYLPIVLKEFPPMPTPTPTPPLAQVYVQNDTGGQLCYEILNTGIGEKCFPGGKSFYGSFPAGTYSWKASAKCGSGSGSQSFSAGEFTHRFWCSITVLQQDQR